MKVFDIIVEAPSPEVIARRKEVMRKNLALSQAIQAQQSQREKARADSQRRRAVTQPELKAKADAPIKTTLGNIKQAAVDTAKSAKTALSKEEIAAKVKNFLSKNPAKRQNIKNRAARTFAQRGFLVLNFAKWLGFFEMGLDYYTNKGILDDMLAEYQQTGNTEIGITPESYQLAVRYEREALIAKLLASTIISKLAVNATMWLTGIKWGVRIVGGASAVASLGSTLAVIAANEVATIAIQRWLQSDKGKEVIAKLVTEVIDPLTPNFISDVLTPEIKKVTDNAVKSAKPTDTKPTTTPPASTQTTTPPGENPEAAAVIKQLK